uniref:Uncharacterized protein n=1 Tax=Lygus hesperus TaxID=30085 RepID=A0A0K8S342_LYGHE
MALWLYFGNMRRTQMKEEAMKEEKEKRKRERRFPYRFSIRRRNNNDESVPSGSPESRPLSDISGYSDEQTTIRKRIKSSSNIHRPLTRYLPIRGETLDLRSHIETAGHQVDLCPHISIDSSSCRGYLQKEGLQVSY